MNQKLEYKERIVFSEQSVVMDQINPEEDIMEDEEYVNLPMIENPVYTKLGTSGLENLGHTCYLNTVIQCLSHTMPLTDYIIRGSYVDHLPEQISTSSVELFVNYVNLLVALWEENCIVAPNTFHKSFGDYFPFYIPYSENDVQETMTFLLDSFHEAISYPILIQEMPTPTNRTELTAYRARKEWHKLQNEKASIVSELFYGLEHSRTQCPRCRKVSHSFAPFSLISLELYWKEENEDDQNHQMISLENLFTHYCRKDQLDYENQLECNKCHQMSRAYKKITFWDLPQFLVISLKRFDNYANKVYRQVVYPLEGLDLTHLVTDPDKKEQNFTYDLYAVALHEGRSIDYGHYYSYCQLSNGEWARFNDADVTPIHDLESLIQSKRAYMLFYKKR